MSDVNDNKNEELLGHDETPIQTDDTEIPFDDFGDNPDSPELRNWFNEEYIESVDEGDSDEIESTIEELNSNNEDINELLSKFEQLANGMNNPDKLSSLRKELIEDDEFDEDSEQMKKNIEDLFKIDDSFTDNPTMSNLKEMALFLEYQIKEATDLVKSHVKDSGLPFEMRRQLIKQVNKEIEPLNKQYKSLKRILLKFKKLNDKLDGYRKELAVAKEVAEAKQLAEQNRCCLI